MLFVITIYFIYKLINMPNVAWNENFERPSKANLLFEIKTEGNKQNQRGFQPTNRFAIIICNKFYIKITKTKKKKKNKKRKKKN